MQEQLQKINEPAQIERPESNRNVQSSIMSIAGDATPEFMKKFTESNKLTYENGREFFSNEKIVREQSEYRKRFDEFVFDSDTRNPREHQRKQLKNCLGKMNQVMARDVWLSLMSEVTEGIDADTKKIIYATGIV